MNWKYLNQKKGDKELKFYLKNIEETKNYYYRPLKMQKYFSYYCLHLLLLVSLHQALKIMSLFLGVDVGTQGTKAVVYDPKLNRVISKGSKSHKPLVNTVPGRAEQDPSEWIHALKESVGQAVQSVDRNRIKAISVSGQQHGLVPLDKNGNVIRAAKLWCDVEASQEAEELSEQFGFTLVPGFTSPKIKWLLQNEPDNFSKMRHVLLPHDYVNYYLCGEYAMECGDASGTGVFDVHQRTFNKQHMDIIHPALKDCFPQLIHHNQSVGKLKQEVADELGLREDVIVGPGSGDNMMSALGAGAGRSGVAVISLGTSGTIFGRSEVAIFDKSGTIAPFCDATGHWLPLLCTMNCTGVAEEVVSTFGQTHQELSAKAEKVSPGCDGVNFLPYLCGERTPNWPHATGSIIGLRAGCMTGGVIYRAALEGASYSLLAGMKAMNSFGMNPTELRAVGGGANNNLWLKILADSFGLVIRKPVEPESAALGAALQAGAVYEGVDITEFVENHEPQCEANIFEPDSSVKTSYNAAFEKHVTFGEKLFK
eukprot:TRINITY_DN18025_c0_g1_i10.p1 TRINITY_DN18025_c0_g1~~TRINITY_DN18025_c0_g1_i10.p1  ORF type:complete len:538 (-),score=95.55 TRINITY_DN18025_c0_g1_i10:668-2281(-)